MRLLVQFRLQAVGGLLQWVLLLSCSDIAHVALGRVLVGQLVVGHGVGVAFGGTLLVGSEVSKSCD